MQVFHPRKRSRAALSETAAKTELREAGASTHNSQSDAGITWLYRPEQEEQNSTPVAFPVDQRKFASSPSRRYDQASYLRADWESLQNLADELPEQRPAAAFTGVLNLYMKVLERAEQKLGAELAAELLLTIGASRNGLSADELMAICGCTAEQIATFSAVLQNHMMPKAGRLTLLNVYISRSIVLRYAGSSGEALSAARERIAAWFESQEISARVAEELPWQLLELGALDRLQSCVTAAGIATTLCATGRRGDLCLYWNALGSRINLAITYGRSLGETSEAGRSELFALLARYYAMAASDSPVDAPDVSALFNERKTARSAGMVYAG